MYPNETQEQPLRQFQRVNDIIQRHGTSRSALIPILQEVQTEFRYLPQEMLSYVATAMGLAPAEVFGVATFYAQFSTEPKGKHIIQVCDGTACHVRGSLAVADAARKALNLKESQITTEDLFATLETVSCLGACALAPAIVIDGQIYGHVTPEQVVELVNGLKEGGE